MAYALIDGNRVCEIVETKEQCHWVQAPHEWVKCDKKITIDHTYVDGKFIEPVQPTEKEKALSQLYTTEYPADISRKLEDILDFLIDNKPLPVNPETGKPFAADWLAERKNIRKKLK